MRVAIEKFSILKKNEHFRIDADFYSHPYRKKIDDLKNRLFFSTLGVEAKFIGSGHTPYKHDVKIGNTPFITVECIGNLDFFFSKTKRITSDQYQSEYKNKIIRKGAVVCTIKRRICKSYPFLSEPKVMAFNQDVALIYPNSKLRPGFLSVYLNCSFGQGLADSLKTEQMNPYISLANLAKLPVPLLDINFQESIEVEDVVLISQRIKSESEEKYQQAQNLLLTELGLNNWQPKHQLTFIRKYSDTVQAERIDAEYFQPKYDEIINAIKAYKGGWDTLESIVTLKNVNFTPNDTKAYQYIELANIAGNGEITNCTTDKGQNLPTRARRKVNTGDVIVSSIEGSLPSIAIIEEEYNDALCSTGFHAINSKHLNSETLLVLLKSFVGQLQLKKRCSGTILTAINQNEFRRIIFPKIPQTQQLFNAH